MKIVRLIVSCFLLGSSMANWESYEDEFLQIFFINLYKYVFFEKLRENSRRLSGFYRCPARILPSSTWERPQESCNENVEKTLTNDYKYLRIESIADYLSSYNII